MAGLELVAGSAVSALLEVVLNKAASYGLEFLGARSELKESVEKLKTSLMLIKGLMQKAEFKKPDWLPSLKDVAYDAENVLDELEYERLKRQVTRLHRPFKLLESSFLGRINEIHARLKHFLSEANQIRAIAHDLSSNALATKSLSSRETTSLIDVGQLYGRDEVESSIIDWLLNATDETNNAIARNLNRETSVLPIFGMGGMGKSTLAKHIFNNNKVTSHFDARAWVHVSENFDEKKIIKGILKSFEQEKTKKLINLGDDNSLEELQKAISNALAGKRFLIVLDDVWNENRMIWDKIMKYFNCGALGSRILVTCRSEKVAKLVATPDIKPKELHGLDNDHLWSLLKQHAFGDKYNLNENQQQLETVGRKIALKLKGSPLAAKTMGQILKPNLSVGHWMSILESELWGIELNENEIMCALLLSYQHLPDHLKPCFTYLSLFPKGWNHSKHDLICRWIALGYVQTNRDGKSLTSVGMGYIDDFINRSLFQLDVGLDGESITMHDLIVDLARLVSKDDIMVIEDYQFSNITQKVRHLSIFPHHCQTDWSKVKSGIQCKHLCSLVVDLSSSDTLNYLQIIDFCKFLDMILYESKYLRLLSIESVDIRKIPSTIKNLKLLRYIKIDDCPIETLPKSLAYLYHLQYLFLPDDYEEKIPPKIINNLLNLRNIGGESNWLEIDCTRTLHFLENLRFEVSSAKNHTLKELAGLNELRVLSIDGLENISCKEEAMDAQLQEKKYLNDLRLYWSGDESLPSGSNNHEHVLEGLRPSASISELCIQSYKGIACPSWMASHQLPNLHVIHLYYCSRLNKICESENLYENMQTIWLEDCEQLQGSILLQNEYFFPPCLQQLFISNCGEFGNSLKPSHLVQLSSLKQLSLCGCAGINYLPTVALHSLVKLEVEECEQLSVEKGNVLGFGALTSLMELKIRECTKLLEALVKIGDVALPPSLKDMYITQFPEELFFQNPICRLDLYDSEELERLPIEVIRSINRLQIYDCPNLYPPKAPTGQLESMEGSNIERFHIGDASVSQLKEWLLFLKSSKLAQLKIEDISELTDFATDELDGLIAGIRSLEILHLKDLEDLRSLPTTLSKHPSLRTVKIVECPEVTSLSAGMFPESMIVEVKDCPKLLKRLPKKEFIETGSGRYEVKHPVRTWWA